MLDASSKSNTVLSKKAATLKPKLRRRGSVSDIFRLTQTDIKELIGIFTDVSPNGEVDKSGFEKCFRIFTDVDHQTKEQRSRLAPVLEQLFSIFDRDGNGVVSTKEYLAGLSVLCDGDRDDKIRAAFELYDENGDGRISLDEMAAYLVSVFSIVRKRNESVFERYGVTPEELADITAEQCFMDAGVDADGPGLTFRQFKAWYGTSNSVSPPAASSLPAQSSLSLQQIRHITGLAALNVSHVISLFCAKAGNVGLDRKAFRECFKALHEENNSNMLKNRHVREVYDRLFDIFDVDSNGVVDVQEIGAGFSLLLGGDPEERIRAAFALYDADGNGYVSLEECEQYLHSVFKMVEETNASGTLGGATPAQLAVHTAASVFEKFDVNHDGKLSYEEFRSFFRAAIVPSTSAQVDSAPHEVGLAKVKQLTGLGSISAEEAFERVAVEAGTDGTVSREAFVRCFKEFAQPERLNNHDKGTLLEILQRLYSAFDVNGDGKLDYSELVSGLGVLCAGSGDDRVSFTWELFDYNGDGYISKDEMIRYLTSVYRVMFEFVPGVASSTDELPEELAQVTTAEAFTKFDKDANDLLDHDEFMAWYRQGKAMSGSGDMTLAQARALLKLEKFDANDVFELFAMEAGDDGTVSSASFERFFENLVKGDEEARRLASRVFHLFDEDGTGSVDFQDLCAGLSVFTGGDKKAEASFRLYDADGSGAVDIDEMVSYLTCVFKVMFLFEAPRTEAVSPTQLARATAEDIFNVYDLDKNQVLSLEEFQLWASGESVTLQQARSLTGLIHHTSEDIFEELALTAGNDGLVTRAHFVEVLTRCAPTPLGVKIGERVFDLFADDATCDFNDISSALSVLCGGDSHQRAEAAFFLRDYDNSGTIEPDELCRYLFCVFRVYELFNGCFQGASAHELAIATAEDIFDKYDANDDGRLDFREFVAWQGGSAPKTAKVDDLVEHLALVCDDEGYVSRESFEEALGGYLVYYFDKFGKEKVDFAALCAGLSTKASGTADERAEAVFAIFDSEGSGTITLDDFVIFLTSVYQTTDEQLPCPPEELAAATAKDLFEKLDKNHDHLLTFDEFKDFYTPESGFARLTPVELFQVLANVAHDEGHVTREGFERVMAQHGGINPDFGLFDLFDANGDGVIDFTELACGLSILTGGSPIEKARAAFDLFDLDHSNSISRDEMELFLKSVYLVLYRTQPGVEESMGASAELLAQVTTDQCFQEADTNHDGSISFSEFYAWYMGEEDADEDRNVDTESPSALERARKLTWLCKVLNRRNMVCIRWAYGF